jgi:hypothetical protein
MLLKLPDHSERLVQLINRPTDQNPPFNITPFVKLRPNHLQHPLGKIEMRPDQRQNARAVRRHQTG